MLESHQGWKLVLGALARLGNTGPLITSYNDMQEKGIQPDLSTYHLVVDSLLATRNRKSITGVVFPLWRAIVQDYPRVQPDIELMNKLIRSCRLSQHYERGFFFLTSMKDCNVVPNLETFRELLNVRRMHERLASSKVSFKKDKCNTACAFYIAIPLRSVFIPILLVTDTMIH